VLRVRYPDGRGRLRQLLETATTLGFGIDEVSAGEPRLPARAGDPTTVEVSLRVHGRRSVDDLAATFSDLDGVDAVVGGDTNAFVE
jgi:hypothetical protein